MSFTITLKNHDKVARLLEVLKNAPVQAVGAIVKGVSAGSQLLLSQAIRERFTGNGPFAVSQRKLGVETGLLRRALRFTRPEVKSEGVVSTRAGANLSYFAAHEFGFQGTVQVPSARVRATSKRKEHTRKAHSRRMNIPKRAPLSAAIEEHSTRIYTEQISKQLGKLIEGDLA